MKEYQKDNLVGVLFIGSAFTIFVVLVTMLIRWIFG